MDITQPPAATRAAAAAQKQAVAPQGAAAPGGTGTGTGTGKAAISSDFQTFLTLLTTQITNQDPMNPMKAEEFAVQLATFSSVEQQVKTNDLLSRMAGGGAGGLSAATGWIGREVRTSGAVQFTGAPVSIDPDPAMAGGAHQLVVTDRNGVEVDRRAMGGDGAAFLYDGRTASGATLPRGTYSFAMESFEGGALVATAPVAGYGRVVEVRSGAAEPELVLAGGLRVPMSDVTAVREAG